MIDDIGDFIRECLIHAADYRYKPHLIDDPEEEQHLHQMELRWLDLAINYEFASRFPRIEAQPEDRICLSPGGHPAPPYEEARAAGLSLMAA